MSRKPKSFPVVAIGASAGGLKAFTDLVNALPPNPGAAFVLVPHLSPNHKSHLAEILARGSALPVAEVAHRDKLLPNRIYVLPPNRTLVIKKGVLHLSALKADHRNSIDAFFRSLADELQENAVGVLLSGEGSDGTQGLRAIKERGGITYAQDGATAAHLSMPHSAEISGFADFVLSPAAIGKRLHAKRIGGDRQTPAAARSEFRGDGAFNGILELLRTVKGVEFELYKRSTLRRRIERRMTLRKFREPQKYLRALKADPEEIERLYQDILICVTSFFREPQSFKALKSAVYPRLLKNRSPIAPIRLWIPGCATGEEAYSHAINLVEFLGERNAHIPFQIFATDVNAAVIEKARVGIYPKKIKSAMSRDRLQRFFIESGDGYRIAPAIRERCVFAVHNLVQDPPFTNLDLISCRNLLIYFAPTLQDKALQIFQYALKPRGVLMLGHSETVGDFAGRFTPLTAKKRVFLERAASFKARIDFVEPARFLRTEPSKVAPESFDLQVELDRALPPRYVPNGVIINGELEILRFLGNTSPYLRQASGKPGMNLRQMATAEVLLEMRAAIHVARKSESAVRKEIAAPLWSAPPRRVRILVTPIKASHRHDEYFLLLFEELEAAAPGRSNAGAKRGKDSRRIIELEEDLEISGEHLKGIIEEQESTNARLKTSNEDLLSSNEELQSLNEEYETTKEELQSTNEELITSTEDVVRSNHILDRANNDLSNLLASVDIAVVLLDRDLTVHRFTLPAEKTLNLSSKKIGRSVLDIKLPLRLSNLKELLVGVIATGKIHETEVQDTRGRWYYMFLRPYRVEKKKIEGAVLALIDIHAHKLAEKTLIRLATVVRDSNDAIIIRDRKDRIIAWNKGAQEIYGYSEAEALGMSFRRLLPGNGRRRTFDLASGAKKKAAYFETQRRAKDGRVFYVRITVTALRDEKGRAVEIATTERDVTAQKRAERELRLLHARVITAQDTERKRLAGELHDGVSQILSGVKYRLESLPGKIPLGARVEAKLRKVEGFLDRAISEVRRVSQNLMPSELEDLGLEPALRTLCREFKNRAGVLVTLRAGRAPSTVAPVIALAVFRIAQEALNNIGKHSKATMVSVVLARKGKDLVLTVSDNGVGFKVGAVRPRDGRGIGLGNMRDRAEALGGSLALHSTPGAGTTLTVRAPLNFLEDKK